MKSYYMDTIENLRLTVEKKDKYTIGHSERVSEYSVLIGRKLNLFQKKLETLKIGGLFHDIGKLSVPDKILSKTTRLTEEEYEKIKKHTTTGCHILSTYKGFSKILPIVRHHHEKYDGTGYPDKLEGEEIPYLARIVTIADAFDAMTSKRPYRAPLPIENAMQELIKFSNIQFDPKLVEVFLKILEEDYEEIQKIQEIKCNINLM